MPVIIPDQLPAAETLQKENIFTIRRAKAEAQNIRPLKILLVNLMPTKEATETQLARVLANSPLQVDLTLLTMGSHDSLHTSREHLETFYKTLEEVEQEVFDGMILTGAPVEKLPFEEVDYWQELTSILDFAKTNVRSSVFICWGAQAALYYYYGIPKILLPQKLFGVFEQKVVRPWNPLMRGFDELFYAPHSRHTTVDESALRQSKELRILAESAQSGIHIVSTEEGRQIFIMGHQEYDKDTLAKEYWRDQAAGMATDVPLNYFRNDNPEGEILFRWRGHGALLFSNWLNYYVYQSVPYDIEEIRKGIRELSADLGEE